MRWLWPWNWNVRLLALVLLLALLAWWQYQERHQPLPSPDLGADAMSLRQAQERPDKLLLSALRTIYGAFELSEPEDIYDALAEATAPDVLELLYLQKQATLQSGLDPASQTLHSIELRALDYQQQPQSYRIGYAAQWAVIGLVGHGVHQHVRGNVYSAKIDMAPLDGRWRMVSFELMDIDRSDAGQPIATPGSTTGSATGDTTGTNSEANSSAAAQPSKTDAAAPSAEGGQP